MKHFQNKSLFNKWLEFSTDDGKEIRVEFKDGGFKHIYEKSGNAFIHTGIIKTSKKSCRGIYRDYLFKD